MTLSRRLCVCPTRADGGLGKVGQLRPDAKPARSQFGNGWATALRGAIPRSAPARALRLHVSDSEKDSRSSNLVSYIASYTPKFCNVRDTASRNLQGFNWPQPNLAISRIRCRVT